ncbi:MAG: PD-(D/E)XK nuclease family protein, partial [Pseudomonadota bacterium]
ASEGALSSDADMLASDIADQLIGLVETLTGSSTAAWAGPDGAAAARCLEETAALIAPLGAVSPTTFAEILRHQAASLSVPEPGRTHPRLSIWGPLEARLQQADRVILAGLNEDVWPQRPPADAFLPRRFRTTLGLAAPEDRLGLAAHDFAQLASAPDVTLLYSARREDAPAVASRWALRLKTLVQGALGADVASVLEPAAHRDPRIWAEALTRDRQDFDAKFAAPRPTPPVAARPDRLSVTRIGTLQRDPYAIYAEHVLRLKKLRPLAEPIDLSLRGTAIHAAIEAFDALDDKAQTADRLAGLIETALHNAGQPQHLILAERASLGAAARQLYAWWDERRARVTASAAEVRGELEWQIAGAPFRLTGVADRVEQHAGGHLAIFDFKTGRVPSLKEVKAGFEQQLPLLALMAREGRLGQWPAADVGELGYVAVKTAFDARPIAWDPDETADLMRLAQETIEKLITNYRDPTAPFLSVPRVQLKSAYAGDYDRLARRSEWAGAVGDGDG